MSTLTKITQEAKRIRKKHPNKYKRLSNPWAAGYVKEAARNVKRGKTTKPAKKKTARKAAPKKARKRAPRKVGALYQAVGRKAAPKKRRTKRKAPRKVGSTRRRSVGGGSNTGLILGLGALALGAVYLFSKDKQPQQQYTQLPQLHQTGNYTRDQQSNNVVQWAMAAGLAISSIASLIDRLNNSNDQQVDTIYSDISSSGNATAWI